jgi:hypothetical protein
MNKYGNEYGNGSGKSNPIREVGIGFDRLSLRAGTEIVFVDKEALKVADILRGSEGDSKRTTDNVKIFNK